MGLIVLTLINLFNYLDRYVVSALVESLKKSDLRLNDAQLGSLMTGFIIVYMATSPVFGALGDRRSRTRLIALGVAIWSVATVLAGLARSFTTLFLARAAVGIGEAAYGTIAPAMLADYYPKHLRGRVFAVFFAAIPIGSALGYVVGGTVDRHFGWRAAFYVAGLPGLLLAALALRLFDPPRGAQDEESPSAGVEQRLTPKEGGWRGYAELLRNRPYLLIVLGYAAYTFALGGIAFWMPAFLERIRGVPKQQATVQFGLIVAVTGLLGTSIGGWLGDYFLRYTKQSYLWISGLATLAAVFFAIVALVSPAPAVYLTAIVIAEVLLFVSTGPINSAIVNVVAPERRATAIAASIFAIHILGDVPSPPLIGVISDRTSLERAVLVVPVAVAVSGIVWLYAALVAGNERNVPLTRRFFRALFYLILRIFFRRIEVSGLERVPPSGPVIFVLNHPNALIDPLFTLCLAPRPVSFLAKVTLFRMPVIGFFVRAFDSLPVYRRQDEGMDPAQNRETFERARDLLIRGGTIAIFPEGASHSDPKLRRLKTGAARIALGSLATAYDADRTFLSGDQPLSIVPAGLYYTAKQTFRSTALLYFGEPIPVQPFPLGPDGEPPREPVLELTARIERALSEVTLQAERAEALALIARAERIFSSGEGDEDSQGAIAHEFELRRRFLAGYAKLRARAPERVAALEAKIVRYEAELAQSGLDPRNLSVSRVKLGTVIRYVVKSVLFFTLLLPAALTGAVLHYPAYRLAGFFAMRLARGDDIVATIKTLAAMLFFPLTWVALPVGLARYVGIGMGLTVLLTAPLAGYATLVFFERLDRFLGQARAMAFFVVRRRWFNRILAERQAIREEILELGKELEKQRGGA